MKREIRFILLLITLATACILAFQMFWIVNSYTVNHKQLLKEVNQALEVSIQREMNIRYSSLASTLYDDNTNEITIIENKGSSINIDSLLNAASGKIDDKNSSMQISFDAKTFKRKDSVHIPDMLNIDLKAILTAILVDEKDNKIYTNIVVLDSLLKDEFKARELDSDYFVEIRNTKKDSLLYSSIDTPINEGSTLYSRNVATSVFKKSYARVAFPNQKQIILTRMGGLLIMSALLLLIVILCFLYMYRTIINQKNLSEIKNDFINNMTHELKTPIATVNAAIEGMQSFDVLEDKKKTNRYLSVSSRELKRLSTLVEKVLNIAAYEKKELFLNIEPINLNDMINNIINTQSIKNAEKTVDIVFNEVSTSTVIEGDRVHMTNVINNLIDNAIKYSEEEVKIYITLTKSKHSCFLSVKDNGIGISAKHQNKVFDKFYRVPTGNLHDVKGFGLGLHYVKNIIEKQEASIELKSSIGKGSEFIISFKA
jgi:two-component system phosphate regulon sensor histidine kinase PhoR